jgi:serine/threonine protein kinase
VVTALGHIHQKNIIHKDINPSNILYDQKNNKIKIIDFGLSADLPKERAGILSPNVLEGSLGYISPEQTGRINRGIDYRTDYYSLGVSFYQMLTGQFPFPSRDPMELVHNHIAGVVQSPHDVDPTIF